MVSFKEIGEIISLINSSSCDELIVETDGVKIVVKRHSSGGSGAAQLPISSPKNPGAETTTLPRSPLSTSEEVQPKVLPKELLPSRTEILVSAPMVGTFYRAPSPEQPPFVEVGSTVQIGDPLCVIEVMKLFTTLRSEIAGTVRRIGADDAQLVEYGQMIFVIEPG